MSEKDTKIELLIGGYKIHFVNGDTGILRLHWGLRSADGVNKQAENNNDFLFFFKWHLEYERSDGTGHDNFFEEVELPMVKYTDRDSYQLTLVDALKKIFVRIGHSDVGFIVFLVKHFDIFFNRLEKKLTDVKLNISLVTDIFEQALLLSASEFPVDERIYIYPEKKGGKNE